MSRKLTWHWKIYLHTGPPAYLQMITRIAQEVQAGRMRPGDQLPTVRELAALVGVNFNTSARAYRGLKKMGLVVSQRGRGTFVQVTGTTAAVRRASRDALEVLSGEFVAQARHAGYPRTEIRRAVLAALGAPRRRR